MTIQEFARLCGASPQTLRYYDRIGLLKPARTDDWTRYRYYESEQARDFVKIKNLQLADFSIAEIKTLLHESDEAIYNAFEAKLAAQREKLAQIQKIQAVYREESMQIEEKISSIASFLTGAITSDELRRRHPELEPETIQRCADGIEDFRVENFTLLREWRDFPSFSEVLRELPSLADGGNYALIAGTAEKLEEEQADELVRSLMCAAAQRVGEDGGKKARSQFHAVVLDAPNGKNLLLLLEKKK